MGRCDATAVCLCADLDEVLAFRLCHERLQLGCGEGVDETGFGHDEEEDLRAGEDGEFVGLIAPLVYARNAV